MRQAFIDRVAEHFKAHQGEWIDGKDLEVIGGRYAWRSRVSDCRTRKGMTITNRQRYVTSSDGTKFTISEYRYLPYEPLGRDSGEQVPREWTTKGPYTEPFRLTPPEARK